MNGFGSGLIALLGPETGSAILAASFFFGFGFLVYGGTRLVLWVGMSAYGATQRAKRANLPHEPGKPAAGERHPFLRDRT